MSDYIANSKKDNNKNKAVGPYEGFFCGIKNEHLPSSSERKVIHLLVLCARATRVIRKSSEGTKDKSHIASPGDEVLWPPIFFCRMAFKRLPSSPPEGFFSGSQKKWLALLGG